ncbi:MAG: glycine--tRNA ligase subunit beta [Coriobacteriia bacterium]|nr:glycine--tRNA ligase subunit beta [Coriobacteriia bacterium]
MSTRDFVFEIGCEELPSSAVYRGIEQLSRAVPEALQAARLEHGPVHVTGSPRRLAVMVAGLADAQSDSVERFKGPAAKAAFDDSGTPTKAAMGFARSKGVPVEQLEVSEGGGGGGSYVYATVETLGAPATEVLPELLERLATGLDWAKSMRWGAGEARFPRPVRWLLALFGTEVVEARFAGLTAGNITYGHRFLAPGGIVVPSAGAYLDMLKKAFVLADATERGRAIKEGIADAAASAGGVAVLPEKTLAEVVNLVEWPTVATGRFDEDFLDIPREMLESAMTGHQRYFPLEDPSGGLSSRFIVVHNGDPERTAHIISGHERVIRARLADAAFFYQEDAATPLEDWLPKLEHVVFQKKLGTLAEKARRIERLVPCVGGMLGTSPDDLTHARRAACLAKADLVTNAVIEFTDLQGVMGRYYAEAAGEADEVSRAIEEHYRPRFAGDTPPLSPAGKIVAIADKTDTICGVFAAGLAPRGSSDPFALRRSAIGILQIVLGDDRHAGERDQADGSHKEIAGGGGRQAGGRPAGFDLSALIASALSGYADVVGGLHATAPGAGDPNDGIADAVRAFMLGRFEGILQDRGYSHDLVAAVFAAGSDDPCEMAARCAALDAARSQAPEVFEDMSVAYKRAANLSRGAAPTIDRELMGEHEIALDDALGQAEERMRGLADEHDYGSMLQLFAGLREPIDAFFDNVLVMDEDPKVRGNRLGLLARFTGLFSGFADFGQLAG